MTKILSDNIIPSLKQKVSANSSNNLKTYAVEPTADGILNIVDNSLPSTPTNGLFFALTVEAEVNNPRLKFNSDIARGISTQHFGPNNNPRSDITYMAAYNNYLIAWVNNGWRALNMSSRIWTDDIVDGAVTAAKADVAGIMNYAGNNVLAFGLGGICKSMGNIDLNQYPAQTGFYMGYDGANRPTTVQTKDDWWYVEQQVHNANYIVQIARSFFNTHYIYQRVKTNGTWQTWWQIMDRSTVLERCYPVGSVYISSNLSTTAQVAAALGGGTWIQTSVGTALVGVNTADGDFNTVLKTGGSKTVTLTVDQIPSHRHTYIKHNPAGNSSLMGSGSTAAIPLIGQVEANTTYAGGGGAHTNLQPYATFYMYRRTA